MVDDVVVGSGAGGGTLAARLAEGRHERNGAGSLRPDPATLRAKGLPEDTEVPAFHPFASENRAIAWNYRVHDFGDDAERRPGVDASGRPGVLYPRASTLGGCTAHNAMILMAPSDRTGTLIAALTGDPSWRADVMRGYFRRVENCRYRPLGAGSPASADASTRPGTAGPAGSTSKSRRPWEAFGDRRLIRTIIGAIAGDLDVGGRGGGSPALGARSGGSSNATGASSTAKTIRTTGVCRGGWRRAWTRRAARPLGGAGAARASASKARCNPTTFHVVFSMRWRPAFCSTSGCAPSASSTARAAISYLGWAL